MRLVLVMAANDLQRRLRDRSAVISAFVAPVALAVIISVALGATGGGFEATIGVVDADGSDVSRALIEGLLGDRRQEAIRFVPAPSERAATAQVADGQFGAALVFPSGFGQRLPGPDPPRIMVIRHSERAVTGDVATAVAEGVASRLRAVSLSVTLVATAQGGQLPPERLAELGARAAATELPVALDDPARAGDELDLASYFGPSMGIVFLFFTVGFGAQSLLAERRDGTLARLRAAPVSVRQIVAAKTLSVFVVGLASLLTLWLSTRLLFAASWGPPLPVLALCLATVLSIAGISALVTSVARTQAQAEGYTAMVAFTLAVLGGNFVPPGDLPDLLRRLSLLTPNGWALSAFTDLSLDAGLAEIVPTLGVLAAIGAVTGAVALGLLQRVVRT